MDDFLLKYYGVDWAAATFTALGLILLGQKKKVGFLCNVVAGALWITFNALASSLAGVLINALVIGLSAHAWWQWYKKPPVEETAGESATL